MGRFIDMTGWAMSEHGVPDSRLTVIKRHDGPNADQAHWLCECSCAEHNQVVVCGTNLRKGVAKSCGCIQKELAAQNVMKVQHLGAEAASTDNKRYNDFNLHLEDEHGSYGIGYCRNTGREFYFDMDDYDKIKDICWCESIRDGFSMLKGRDISTKKVVSMHAFLGCGKYDHIDRNELNNRRYNLRPATHKENSRNHSVSKRNSSGIVGVTWRTERNKWVAYICVDNETKYLGLYSNKDDAIVARLKAENEYFKEFAPQKHLYEKYGITPSNKEG